MLALVTALYGAIIALLIIVTALGVVKVRQAEQVGLGAGGSARLQQKIRVHANLTEYAPISLLLLLFLELNRADILWLHVFGITLVVGRVLHIWGLSRSAGYSIGRFGGTLITMLNIVAMSLANVFLLLRTV